MMGIAGGRRPANTARHFLDLGDMALFGGGKLIVHASASQAIMTNNNAQNGSLFSAKMRAMIQIGKLMPHQP